MLLNPYVWAPPSSGGGTLTGDPSFASVVSLLHFDGADGSTAFTDSVGALATTYGAAKINTAQSKFGGASGYFDGSAGTYVKLAPRPALQLGSDFTVEFWLRVSILGIVTVPLFFGAHANGAGLLVTTYTGTLYVSCGAANLSVNSAIAVNTWTHVALTRSGGTLKVFVNGVLSASAAENTTFAGWDTYAIGAFLASGSSESNFVGNIDELRVTNGVARYSSNFTPATTAFPDAIPVISDPFAAYVQSLIHFDNIAAPTVYVDVKGNTVTNVGASQTAAQPLFGAGSMAVGASAYARVEPAANLAITTAAFTLEFAFNLTAPLQVGKYIFSSTVSPWTWVFTHTDGTLHAMVMGNDVALTAVTPGQWHTFAITRDTSNFTRVFIDGVIVWSAAGITTVQTGNVGWEIGVAASPAGASSGHPGFFDEWRLTIGACRYTADYTPATAPFP